MSKNNKNIPNNKISEKPKTFSNFADLRNVLSSSNKEDNKQNTDLHNPYNFIPALPRDLVTDELGDHEPTGHDSYKSDKFSGRLSVKLTVKTPLIIVDAASAKEHEDNKEHKIFDIRLGQDGKPLIPVTSVKGMLRSAYEAITNSRMSVFSDHHERLACRMIPSEGLSLVPARVEKVNEQYQIKLLTGTSNITRSRNDPLYAAWLPRYYINYKDKENRNNGTISRTAILYPNGKLPKHGEEVNVWLENFAHRSRRFNYWRVQEIVPINHALGTKPTPTTPTSIIEAEGYVCVTSRPNGKHNMDNKHDERVFFTAKTHPDIVNLSAKEFDCLKKAWCELIKNYGDTHKKEVEKKDYKVPASKHSELSRHIVNADDEKELKHGTLCYARLKQESGKIKVVALYPVNISRELYELAPADLLSETLKPATSIDKLSPADRVFGWVRQSGKGAYRGNLRISQIKCLTPKEQAIEEFQNQPLPLAILGEPKPQQARFYLAKNKQGQAPDNKEDISYTNKDQTGLRGRKVYPHHNNLPENYWINPLEDRTQIATNGFYQEYRRPRSNGTEQCDSQNRSLKNWVKPGTEFSLDINVTNLSKVELGALLWLLELPENHFHRLAGGKPLGFGSVRLELDQDKSDIRSGEDWKKYYLELDEISSPVSIRELINEIKKAYKDEVKKFYSNDSNFDQVSFIMAFLRSSKGFEDKLPIHYPRTQKAPNPDGKIFEWFTANNKKENRFTLKDLVKKDEKNQEIVDTGLPILKQP